MWYKDKGYIVAILANSDQTDFIDISYFLKIELSGTKAEKQAYQHTRDLLKNISFEKPAQSKETLEKLNNKSYDESLLQIKGYYYFNNQDYAKAKTIFRLNTILFPDSEADRRDYSRVEEK